MTPLRIYLDTQDYARLYTNREKEHDDILNYLLEKVDNKSIEIYYSYVIIGELIQNYRPEYKQDRADRIKILKRLCGRNCFLYIERLNNSENATSVIGDWLPIFPITQFLEKGIKEGINDEISTLSRRQRRQFTKGNFLRNYIKSSPAIYRSFLSQEKFDFPLPESFISTNVFMRYLCGEVSKSDMDSKINEILFDLDKFLITWFEYSKKENLLFELLRQSTQGYLNCVNVFSNIILKVQDSRDTIKLVEDQLKQTHVTSELRKSIEDTKRTLSLIENADAEYIRKHIPSDKVSKIPSFFLDLIIAYLRESTQTKRKVNQSDGGDLLHAVYLPYCDLWRGDASFCSLLKEQKVQHSEKIVTKLSELPDRIEQRLRDRK